MDKQDSIKCKYLFKDDYNPLYVNGAHGGINPLGEIIVHFFLERNALPNSETFKVSENGQLGAEAVKSEPEDLKNSFVRYVQTGIVLNYQTAKEIHRWLDGHIKKLEEIGKKTSQSN